MITLVSIFEQQWFAVLMTAFATGIAGLITWSFTLLRAWLSTKIQNERLRSALDLATEIVYISIKTVNQTFVDSLKEEGKFDAEAQKQALALAKAKIFETMSEETRDFLTDTFGDLELWIEDQIEAFIYDLNSFSKDRF